MGNIAAFDIGGTFVKHGVISENGEVFFSKEYKTHAEKGGKWIIENLCAIVCELMKKQEISGVAISTAGVVDPEAGKIVYANENIPGYTGTEIKKIVEEHCGIPCEVENDVACAGLAEAVLELEETARRLCVLQLELVWVVVLFMKERFFTELVDVLGRSGI